MCTMAGYFDFSCCQNDVSIFITQKDWNKSEW